MILFPTSTCRFATAFLAMVAMMTAAPPARAQAQSPLPRVELHAGIHLIHAEVASNDQTRARGLMFRDRLAPQEGMLFVFETPARQCFWMRNTRIPLSIAFLEDDGSIVNIEKMQALSDDSHCSARPVRFALEMNQGWFEKRGFNAGSRIAGPKGLFIKPR